MAKQSSKGIYLKSEAEIDSMRRAGHLLSRVMSEVVQSVHEGMTTRELDKIAYSKIKSAKAIPGFLGLYDFPATLCISLNEEVVHGIPGKRKLENGDVVSIDCGLILEGFYSDMAYTAAVGDIDDQTKRLLEVTNASLYAGIDAAQVGGRVGHIGAAVEQVVHQNKFHCIEDYTGHGIGRCCHEDPRVFNDSRELGKRIRSGMTVAIEPMVAVGTGATRELSDKWTVVTEDGSTAAHYEHTIAITSDGVEILTLDPDLDSPLFKGQSNLRSR